MGTILNEIVNEERLQYYPVVESGQFKSARMIGMNAHVECLYTYPNKGGLYIRLAWALLIYQHTVCPEPNNGNR